MMARGSRLVGLAFRINAASRLKVALLSLLVVIGMLVFLGVTELSRASKQDLDDAIVAEQGLVGTWSLHLHSDLGLGAAGLAKLLDDAARANGWRPLILIEELGAVNVDCASGNLGSQPVMVAYQPDGTPVDPTDVARIPDDPLNVPEQCLDGLIVPFEAMRIPENENLFGATTVLLHANYRDYVKGVNPTGSTYRYLVVTGTSTDPTSVIDAALADASKRNGEDGAGASSFRVDDGSSIRDAAAGISLVYSLIGWGVLLLGGIGLLVAEVVALQARTWFYGLARVNGATALDIALLVVIDIVLIVGVGLALTVAIAAATAWPVRDFGLSSFGVEMVLLRASALRSLAVGALGVVAIGAALPAYKAVRLEPIDVLGGS